MPRIDCWYRARTSREASVRTRSQRAQTLATSTPGEVSLRSESYTFSRGAPTLVVIQEPPFDLARRHPPRCLNSSATGEQAGKLPTEVAERVDERTKRLAPQPANTSSVQSNCPTSSP